MDFFTVGDIARRIMEEGDDFEVVRGQLRTWVNVGLLKPDERNPGTGLHRQFSERAVIEAAVFARLAKRYDIGSKIGPLARRALDRAFKQLPKVKDAGTLYLCIGVEGSGSNSKPWGVVHVSSDQQVRVPPNVEDVIVINLNKVFDRVRIPLSLYTARRG